MNSDVSVWVIWMFWSQWQSIVELAKEFCKWSYSFPIRLFLCCSINTEQNPLRYRQQQSHIRTHTITQQQHTDRQTQGQIYRKTLFRAQTHSDSGNRQRTEDTGSMVQRMGKQLQGGGGAFLSLFNVTHELQVTRVNHWCTQSALRSASGCAFPRLCSLCSSRFGLCQCGCSAHVLSAIF